MTLFKVSITDKRLLHYDVGIAFQKSDKPATESKNILDLERMIHSTPKNDDLSRNLEPILVTNINQIVLVVINMLFYNKTKQINVCRPKMRF